jgi:short-subunit dehydrogenase
VHVTTTARPPLDGGTALVTGASAGIGRELAIQLAPRLSALILVARRVDRLKQLQTELVARHPQLKVLTVAADLSDEDEVAGVIARVSEIGSVDLLVNAAGLGASGLFDRTDWSRTRQVLRTNVVALAQLSAALVPAMVANGRGGVLNIGSGAGLTVMPAAAAYTGSKHFVDGFSEALRADLAGTGVVVTQICPGPVDSEFDEVAGSPGGMMGSPPPFMRISAAQCAREALSGFDRGAALVFPGRPYRLLMCLLFPLVPRRLRRWQTAQFAARLRTTSAASRPS